MNITPARTIVRGLMTAAVLVWSAAALAEKPKTAQAPPSVSDVAEAFQQIGFLRLSVADFFMAFDKNTANQTADTVLSRWQALPAEVRSRIEGKHPGTALRLTNLRFEFVDTRQPPTPQAEEGATLREATSNAFTATTESLTPTWGKTADEVTPATSTKGLGAVAAVADTWSRKSSTAPRQETRSSTPAAVRYSDEFDIFGDRPKSSKANW